MHEWRSDIAQLACSVFLLLEGPGPWSLDATVRSSGTDRRETGLRVRAAAV
jgi:hypothetical protein